VKVVAKNKKAYFDYHIEDKLEVGIVLEGGEIKAIRASRVNLKDSFVKFIKNEPTLFNAHVSLLDTTNAYYKPDSRRARKLLMNKKEILKWEIKVKQQSLTVVPLMLYFNNKNIAKLQIALAKGKKNYDKREDIKAKDMLRDAQRDLKQYR
jgi:SsrA-binding protein